MIGIGIVVCVRETEVRVVLISFFVNINDSNKQISHQYEQITDSYIYS